MPRSRLYRIIIHALFWVIFFTLSVAYIRNFLKLIGISLPAGKVVAYTLLATLLYMAPIYFNYFVLLPLYFIARRVGRYVLLCAGAVLLSSAVFCVMDDFFLRPFRPDWLYTPGHFVSRLPYFILFIFLINFFYLFDEVMRKQKQEADLKRVAAETESKWLKAQVSPHFLFNALNNIYSLAYAQSHLAAPAVMRLSEMMRYVLQETGAEKISLSKETAYLKNYVDLQSLKKRYAGKIHTVVELADPEAQIEPLLFINFVENAFKHSNLEEDGARVALSLSNGAGWLRFAVENTYNRTGGTDKTHGIGLENVKKRLQLLYPAAHKLNIIDAGGVYSVTLTITTG